MSQLVDDILSSIDIVDVVSGYVKLKRAGKNFLGLCPFHSEKSPSFTVAPDKQIYKCFGCGQGGNVISFVQEVERIDFRETCKILCKQANLDINKYRSHADQYEAKTTEREQSKLINQSALIFFQQQLRTNTQASSYLHQTRGLSDADIANRWLGYAPTHYDQLIKYLLDQGYTQLEIIASWLGKVGSNGSLYSMFRHRVMFAIYDHMGNIVWFAGRALDPDDSPKYLNISETSLYNKSNVVYGLHRAKQHVAALKHIVIVEWYMDVIWLSKFGLPIGVATCGTSLTAWHIKLLKRYQATLICAFDNDAAGFQAMTRWLGLMYEYDIYPKVLTLPSGIKDIDEWQKSEADQGRGQMDIDYFLTHTSDWFQAVLKRLLSIHDPHNPIHRKLIISAIFDILKHVADYSVLMLYITQVSQTLQIDQTLLFNQYKSQIKGQTLTTLPKQSMSLVPYSQDILLASLMLDQMLSRLTTDPAIAQMSQMIVSWLNLLQDTRIADLIASQHTEILTAQMRWDKQMADQDQAKKNQYLTSFLIWYMQGIIKQVAKSDCDPESKHKLSQVFQTIVKQRLS